MIAVKTKLCSRALLLKTEKKTINETDLIKTSKPSFPVPIYPKIRGILVKKINSNLLGA